MRSCWKSAGPGETNSDEYRHHHPHRHPQGRAEDDQTAIQNALPERNPGVRHAIRMSAYLLLTGLIHRKMILGNKSMQHGPVEAAGLGGEARIVDEDGAALRNMVGGKRRPGDKVRRCLDDVIAARLAVQIKLGGASIHAHSRQLGDIGEIDVGGGRGGRQRVGDGDDLIGWGNPSDDGVESNGWRPGERPARMAPLVWSVPPSTRQRAPAVTAAAGIMVTCREPDCKT